MTIPGRAGSTKSLSRRRLVAVLVTVIAGIAVVFVGRSLLGAVTPHLYSGTVLQSRPAPTMDALRFATGEAVELDAFRGKVVVVFFGYTNCPDVCPTTLADASQALRALTAAERQRVQFLMVSVDPDRDQPEDLRDYVEAFDPTFAGVTGELPDIQRVATQYGIHFKHGEESAPGSYFVDHTATLMGIDTDGALRVVWSPTVTQAELADDLRHLLEQ